MIDNDIPEMIDMVFDLDGGTLPAAYPFALWGALLRHAPQLAEEKLIGVLPLRSTVNSQGMLLAKRAKLAIRMPTTIAESASASLMGQQLDIAGSAMRVGSAKPRPIQPYPTIHAQLVTGESDEVLFVEDIRKQMEELGVTGKLICGKRLTINGSQRSIHGYSLVVHDVKPEASLQLQYVGLGDDRQFGCGIFVPYKVITGLSED
ncbi:MAG: type I-MYXAN CRISPR-associated protein Cas6/Cmx6 [Pseudomonadota bacterium]